MAGRFTTYGGQPGAFLPAPKARSTRVKINPIASPYDKLIAQARASLATPGALRTTANQQVGAQINAALGASTASSKLEQQQFADLQNRALGFASALGHLEAGMAPSVGQAYQNAANALGSYGTGLTGAVAADEQAAAEKARAQVSGLIGEQNANLVGGYDIPGLRSTAQYTGVTLPASDLGAQAATAVRLQNAAATTGFGSVQNIAKDYAQQAIDALNQRAAERAQIIAQRPELFQTALEAQRQDRQQTLSTLSTLTGNRASYLQNRATLAEQRRQFGITEADKVRQAKIDANQQTIENARADRQLGITESYLNNTMRQTGASITGYDPVTGDPTFNTVQGNRTWADTKNQRAATWTATNGYKSDAHGNPILKNGKLQPAAGYKLDKTGTGVVRTYAPSRTTATGPGGLSAASMKDLVSTVNTQLEKGLSPKTDIKTYNPNDPNADENGYVHSRGTPTSYPDALNSAVSTLVASGVPARAALQRAQILVNAKYKEGVNGRPFSAPRARRILTDAARQAFKAGYSADQAIAEANKQAWKWPPGLADKITRSTYRRLYPTSRWSPIPGSKQFGG